MNYKILESNAFFKITLQFHIITFSIHIENHKHMITSFYSFLICFILFYNKLITRFFQKLQFLFYVRSTINNSTIDE
jgi:hypothetical protein